MDVGGKRRSAKWARGNQIGVVADKDKENPSGLSQGTTGAVGVAGKTVEKENICAEEGDNLSFGEKEL